METKTAIEVMSQIEEAAKSHQPDVRRAATMKVGEVARQGDVYLERIEGPLGDWKATKERQLAPGTSKGSRHVVAASVDCRILEAPGRDPLQGPCIISKSRLLVEHPEHGHLDLPPGCYAVSYQRQYARERAEELRRVQD